MRILDRLRGLQVTPPVYIPPPKPIADLADWLRGDEARLATLVAYLNHRIEGRENLPTPSNPHEVFVLHGRDREAREIARMLTLLCYAPAEDPQTGRSETEDE